MMEIGSRGFSVTETLIVITLLGIAAVVAIPSLSPIDEPRLDLAASEIANALRFARSEALRTGQVHGVDIDEQTEQVTVSKTDLGTVPVSPEYVLYHPVKKQLWDFNVNTDSATAGVEITNTTDVFDYMGTGRFPTVLFNGLGTPLWIDTGSSTIHQLADGEVTLEYRGLVRSVRVAPITGRVTIQ